MGMVEDKYGSLTAMVGHDTWDQAVTTQAAGFLKALAEATAKFHKEMREALQGADR